MRDTLSAPALRERAQRTYRLAREGGQRVTGAQLGHAYGRGERWGRQQIEAVEHDDAHGRAHAQFGGVSGVAGAARPVLDGAS